MDAMSEFVLREGEDAVWETFHVNSKTSRAQPHLYFDRYPSDATVVAAMRRFREVKPYTDRAHVPLPRSLPDLDVPLEAALAGRASARGFARGEVALDALAKVLFCAYGMTRDNAGTEYPRPFRASPSGGALYPLELYVQAARVSGLRPGMYHYDPVDHELDDLGDVDLRPTFVQQDLADDAAAVLLLTGVFFRSAFKYGDRGYRFVLLEAGHVAQNALLAAGGLGLAGVPVGGFFDREADDGLGVDGLNESLVYAVLLGQPEEGT